MENRNGYYQNPQGYNYAGAGYNQPGAGGYGYAYYQQRPEPKDPFINREARHITKLSLLAGAAILSFVGMQNIMSVLLSWSGLSGLYMSSYSFQMIFSTLCTVICIFVPFLIIYALYSKGDRDKCFEFGKPVSKKAFLLAVSAGLMVCFVSDYIASGFNCFVSAFGVSFADIDQKAPSSITEFLLFTVECAVVPAIVEEFAVRGVIMQPLRRYGDRFAIVMSTVIFAIMHGNMMQIPVALVAGFALGYFAIATNSIWTSVAIHFANNFFAVILTAMNSGSASDSMTVLTSGISFVLIAAIVAAGIYSLVKFTGTEHYGLGLTAAPKIEKLIFIITASAFVLISAVSAVFDTVLPVFYIGSAVIAAVFFFVYRNENRKMLRPAPVTGLPQKLMVSLYIASPTLILAYYSLTLMTVQMVNFEGVGSYFFCFLLFALYFAVSIYTIHNVRSSKLLENKKPYVISVIAVAGLGFFTLILLVLSRFSVIL